MSSDAQTPPNREQPDSVTPSERSLAPIYPDSLYPQAVSVTGIPKIRTNIEGFDDISHGGLPMGRTTLVSGTSGTGKTLLCMQFLYNGIRHFAEPGVFVTFEESPEDIIRNASSFGWDLQSLIDTSKLFILDATPEPGGYEIAGEFDLSALIERIQYAINKYKAKRVAIDSVTAIFQQFPLLNRGSLASLP